MTWVSRRSLPGSQWVLMDTEQASLGHDAWRDRTGHQKQYAPSRQIIESVPESFWHCESNALVQYIARRDKCRNDLCIDCVSFRRRQCLGILLHQSGQWLGAARHCKVRGNQRISAPVEHARGKAVMLRQSDEVPYRMQRNALVGRRSRRKQLKYLAFVSSRSESVQSKAPDSRQQTECNVACSAECPWIVGVAKNPIVKFAPQFSVFCGWRRQFAFLCKPENAVPKPRSSEIMCQYNLHSSIDSCPPKTTRAF